MTVKPAQRQTPTEVGYDRSVALGYIAKSKRKRQVVRGLARGFTMEEIGQQIGISKRTVAQHVADMRYVFGDQRGPGIPRRELPLAWYVLTGENPYPTDEELERTG